MHFITICHGLCVMVTVLNWDERQGGGATRKALNLTQQQSSGKVNAGFADAAAAAQSPLHAQERGQ